MKLLNSFFEKLQLSSAAKTKDFPQSLIDLLPNYYIFWKDKNSAFLGCNQAFAKLMGLSAAKEVIGKTDRDFPWIKEKSGDYTSDDKQIMASRKPKLNIEESFPLPHGAYLTLLTSKIPLFDEQNNVYGVLGISFNYTQQKQIEEQAKQDHFKLEHAYQEARYLQDSLMDCIPNYFIFWKDINSVYLGCNTAYAITAGVKYPANIIGKTDYELPWSKTESDAYRAIDQRVMQSRKPELNIIEPQTLPDGKKIVLLTSKVPLINLKGEVYGILGIYSDITEQKNAEQKLIDSNKKLELATQAKSEFIRNITHDIRTPLSGIQQTVRMISEGKIETEEISEYASQAFEATNQLMNIFNQIINVTKKEEFDFEDQVVKFDLYKLLDSIHKTYAVLAKHKNLSLEVEYSQDVPEFLLGKQQRLHRILLNLLGNALKFTDTGSVKLLVENSKNSEDKVILRISVIDTGIGIPEDKHAAIFEPFGRLQPSYQGQYVGSGLGLHLVKEYVEKMQGEIYVESEVGHGSIFICVLPFKRPILENDDDIVETEYTPEIVMNKPKASPRVKQVTTVQNQSAGFRILLVEDDYFMQTIAMSILKDVKNYQIDLAKSGEEALELTGKNAYDIIYMDIGLPQMDGIETTRQIRSNLKNLSQNAFITALTAHADEEIIKKCLEAGMQQVLFKPLTPEKIKQVQAQLTIPQMSDDKKEIIDWTLWYERVGQNKPLAEKSFHLLAESMSTCRGSIKDAYATHDLPHLQRLTHIILGTVVCCGLPRLEEAVRAMASAAREGNISEIDHWYSKVSVAMDEVEKAYQDWTNKHLRAS